MLTPSFKPNPNRSKKKKINLTNFPGNDVEVKIQGVYNTFVSPFCLNHCQRTYGCVKPAQHHYLSLHLLHGGGMTWSRRYWHCKRC